MYAESSTAAEIRSRLIDATVRLLATEGPAAVQARRLGSEISASTTAVYHYFGGLPKLLRSVSDEGFHRLRRHLRAIPVSDDPIADLCTLAVAYRRAAHENPHLYDLMFGMASPGGHRLAEANPDTAFPGTDAAQAAYAPLIEAAARAFRAGRLSTGNPTDTAAQLWTLLHGYVSLELAGHFEKLDHSLNRVLVPLGVNLFIALGDHPEHAATSALVAIDELRDQT